MALSQSGHPRKENEKEATLRTALCERWCWNSASAQRDMSPERGANARHDAQINDYAKKKSNRGLHVPGHHRYQCAKINVALPKLFCLWLSNGCQGLFQYFCVACQGERSISTSPKKTTKRSRTRSARKPNLKDPEF